MATMTGGDDATAVLRHVALSVPSRRRILRVLSEAGRPLDAGEVAAAAGLHVTTVRGHLDVLQEAGLVRWAVEPVSGPGRPPRLFAVAGEDDTEEGHRTLAALLAGVVAEDPVEGPERAERAGRRWAERELPPSERLTAEEATRGVTVLFDRLGFAPRLAARDGDWHVDLYACPFRAVAREHPEVVCRMHLGLLRGALERLGARDAAQAAGLRPFVGPELCVADVPVP